MSDIRSAVRAAIEGDRARFSPYRGASVAALFALAAAAPAVAQTAAPSAPAVAAAPSLEPEEIVVTGYRKSLQSSQTIKKESAVVVDSVTASDIGELPDRSVTEALQRIPGVSINRFSAGIDPDHFSVEGSGVVVRGLTYVASQFNGRETFTANNGHGLSFADVPAELLAGADVFKSQSADRIEGGIAGVINLRTRLPFDSKGTSVSGSLEENYGDFAKKSSPAGSVLASTRWETGIGEFGALASISSSEIKSRADKIQVSNFAKRTLYSTGDVVPSAGATPQGSVYFPRGAVEGSQLFDRKRRGYSAALQWRSPDQSWEATAQFLRSDSRESWTERTSEIATDNVANNGDSQAVPGTTLSFDPSGLFSSGVITGGTGWRSDQFTGNARTPVFGLQSNNISRSVEQKNVNDDIGAHLKWKATDNLALDFDYQHVKSTVDNLDVSLWTSSYQDASIRLNGTALPVVAFQPPSICIPACTGAPGTQNSPAYFTGTHTSFADPFNSFYRAAMDHIEQSDGKADAAQLDGTLTIPDNDWLSAIKSGVRFSDHDQTARFSKYNWGVLSEQWGNNGPVWLDTPIAANGNAPLAGYETNTFNNFFRGQTPSPVGADGRLYYSGNGAQNYQAFVDYANLINRQWQPGSNGFNGGWNSLYTRPGVIPGTPFVQGEINPQTERNSALYLMMDLSHKLQNGWKLTGNVGVRYTKTTRHAVGGQAFPVPGTAFLTDAECTTAQQNGGTTPAFCTFSLAVRQQARDFFNGAFTPTTVTTSYSFVLPSINLKLDLNNGLQFRADYFKGVAPPEFGLTRNYYNVTADNFASLVDSSGTPLPETVIDIGNPNLRPSRSDNVDLGVEWYFSPVGQLTLSMFWKDLKDVATNGTVNIPLTNNGATLNTVVHQPRNATDVGIIKGFELGYQQTYDFLPGFLKGFGLNANYTYVDSQGVRQSTLSATDPNVAAGNISTVDTSKLPLQGLSKSTINFAPFYQRGPIEVRAAYSWRSKFLLTVRDVIVPYQPIINEATGQLDGSIIYSANSHVKIALQVANLLDEVTKTSAVIADDLRTAPRGFYINDRRYTLGVRWVLN